MTVQLRAIGLAKQFGRDRIVFDRVDFELGAATLTELIGPNGSGKSTLLRVLAGVEIPTRGRVVLAGRRALVPERFVPPAQLSPISYLRHMARLQGVTRSVATVRARELLERLGAADAARTAMQRLSKGTVQKVAIAQAFLAPAELMLLDEPYAGLDDAAATALGELIASTCAAGAAIVFCEHERTRRLPADQVLLLRGGEAHLTRDAFAIEREPTAMVRLIRTVSDPAVPVSSATPVSWNGFIASSADGELVLRVPRTIVNDVLAQAIAARWHVWEVRETREMAS